jgi:hypothetical protein
MAQAFRKALNVAGSTVYIPATLADQILAQEKEDLGISEKSQKNRAFERAGLKKINGEKTYYEHIEDSPNGEGQKVTVYKTAKPEAAAAKAAEPTVSDAMSAIANLATVLTNSANQAKAPKAPKAEAPKPEAPKTAEAGDTGTANDGDGSADQQ